MISLRLSSNETGLGEPDQDANSALTELDKSLRSGKIGEQSEAIVRFPKLFEKYPFPILINSSFLKLADVFRTGSNFLRIWILRVFEQSEKHLDKILNVDEFVRRLFSVMHSNDPVARALTLRTLGACAGIIPERQQVHHSIHRSLDSNDTVEVQAAIKAAEQFAAKSKTFAVSMCNKISDMIQGQVTPAYMKLELIPILQYMHHDTTTAIMVRQLCTDLLPKYPEKAFVKVTLNSLTQLSAATLVDIPEQVSLLLHYLKTDFRWPIKAQALKNLKQLAGEGAHLWPPGAVESITDVALNTDKEVLQSLSLSVIQVLVQSPVTCHAYMGPNSKVRVLCDRFVHSPSLAIATQAVEVLTKIACYCYKENLPVPSIDELVSHIEGLLSMILVEETTEKLCHQLRLTLRCTVALCRAHSPHCINFTDLIGSNLMMSPGKQGVILCESLGAIGCLQSETLLPLLPEFCTKLTDLNDSENADSDTKLMQVMLCTLIFQTMSNCTWDANTKQVIENIIRTSDQWTNYRIARSATRYGHHNIAESIFADVTLKVSSEHFYFWLMSLREISKAESRLLALDGTTNRVILSNALTDAINHYSKATTALKAASTPTNTLQFQYEYTRLRSDFLDCLLQLIHACISLCTAPPPAIASSIAQSTRDDLQRFGHITQQLRASAKEFKVCSESYQKLYQTAFDADPNTLINVQILQQMCVIMSQSIERICLPNSTSAFGDDSRTPWGLVVVDTSCLENRLLNEACERAGNVARELAEEKDNKSITHKHIESLVKQVTILSTTSLCLPRYFYQILQSTTVKLSITPQPRVLGEAVSVPHGSQLAVKVEGVIQHARKPGLFRSVNEVIVTVTSQLQARANHEVQPASENTQILTQTVIPHRDFFTAQFLLAFIQGGQYLLSIEACLVDAAGCIWSSPPKTSFPVKVYEEPGSRQNTQTHAGTSQTQPNQQPANNTPSSTAARR